MSPVREEGSSGQGGKERILIVDDDEIIRAFLECVLVEHGYQVTSAPDFGAVKNALSRQGYDLILADLVFLEKLYSGLDIVTHTLSVYPACRAIILTSYPSTHTAIASLRLQAADYLIKPVSENSLLGAVRNALDDRQRLPLPDGSAISLSAREKETLMYIFKGYNFGEIARNMGCSLSTVKTYSRRIYKKLEVNSRSEAIHEALRQGLIRNP